MPKKKARNKPGVKEQDDKPQTPMEVLFGKTLLTSADGRTNSTVKLFSKEKRLVAIYFAAKDDKTCQEFTPTLIEFYNAVSSEIEIVYVSSDKTATDFVSYFSQMPWVSMLATDEVLDNKNTLAKTLAVTTIPSLRVLDVATGKFVTLDGVKQIQDADKTNYKQLLDKWKETEPVEIEQGVKSAVAAEMTFTAFVKTFLRQTAIIFVILLLVPFVIRQAKILLFGGQKMPPPLPPSGNTEF